MNRENSQSTPKFTRAKARLNRYAPELDKAKTRLDQSTRRAAYKVKHDYLNFENIILAIAAILCISWTWRAISSMSRNWELEQRLSSRERELAVTRLEVGNLEAENDYYKTEEYQELSARKRQGKKLSGETMIYLPDNSDAARNKHKDLDIEEEVETPSNLEQWFSFLFGI